MPPNHGQVNPPNMVKYAPQIWSNMLPEYGQICPPNVVIGQVYPPNIVKNAPQTWSNTVKMAKYSRIEHTNIAK